MPTRQDLSDILSTLNAASDPVHAAKRIVVDRGGDWTDAKGHLALKSKLPVFRVLAHHPTPLSMIGCRKHAM